MTECALQSFLFVRVVVNQTPMYLSYSYDFSNLNNVEDVAVVSLMVSSFCHFNRFHAYLFFERTTLRHSF